MLLTLKAFPREVKLSPDLSLFYFFYTHFLTVTSFHIGLSQVLSGRDQKNQSIKRSVSERKEYRKCTLCRNTAICTQIFPQTSWNKCYSHCFLQHQRWSLKPDPQLNWIFQMPSIILRAGVGVHRSCPIQLPLSLPPLHH